MSGRERKSGDNAIRRAKATAQCWDQAAEMLCGVDPEDAQLLLETAEQLDRDAGEGVAEKALGMSVRDIRVLDVAHRFLTAEEGNRQQAAGSR